MQHPRARSLAAAASRAAFHLPATPASQFSHNGLDPAAVQPVLDLIAARDISAATRTLPPEMAAAQCRAGTPQQCATQIAGTFLPAGFNHLAPRLRPRLRQDRQDPDRHRPAPRRTWTARSQAAEPFDLAARILGLDPADCIAIEHSAAGAASARGGQMPGYRRAAARYPGHPGPRRHADDPVGDGPASVSARPARRPGLDHLNTHGEGNVMNDPEPPTVAAQPTVTYGGPGPVPRPRTDNRPPGPRYRPKPWQPS